MSFSGLRTCLREVSSTQAGFEVYNSLQSILPLPLFILCSSGVSAFLFTHSIPRNSFLRHLHPQHSWKHNHLLSPGRAVWSKWNEAFFPTQSATDKAVEWSEAVTEKSLLYLDSQYKATNPRVRALPENKTHHQMSFCLVYTMNVEDSGFKRVFKGRIGWTMAHGVLLSGLCTCRLISGRPVPTGSTHLYPAGLLCWLLNDEPGEKQVC